MPINAGPQYYAAEKRYLVARTKEDKIAALEEMIRLLPKHKGTSNVLSQLRHRLARLKKETTTKATAKPRFTIKKEGAAQICIVGLTKSGKSSLLNALTNANAEVADYPYTTKEPEVGMLDYGDVQLQLVEIPSTFDSDLLSILHNCDEILMLLDGTKSLDEQGDELHSILNKNGLEDKKIIWVVNKSDIPGHMGSVHIGISAIDKTNLEKLKEKLWDNLSLIRIYTKSPGKPKDLPAIALAKNSTVKDVAKSVHKDFVKNFKYARIFNSTKYSGQKVGLDFVLSDLDVIEIHTK